jgi:hypothetical protein
MLEPIVLFGIQFSLSLVAYALIAFWYVAPRLSAMPRESALVPLLWVHAFRVVGGTILAPGAVDPGVPAAFREMVGYGDLIPQRWPSWRWSRCEPACVAPSRSSGCASSSGWRTP